MDWLENIETGPENFLTEKETFEKRVN